MIIEGNLSGSIKKYGAFFYWVLGIIWDFARTVESHKSKSTFRYACVRQVFDYLKVLVGDEQGKNPAVVTAIT